MSFDRVVVGSGFSGLLAASRAVARGEKVRVVDQASLAGGLLSAISIGGISIDSGAESFSIVDDSVLRLVDELGLTSAVVQPSISEARIVNGSNRYKIPHGYLGVPSSLEDPELKNIISEVGLARAAKLDAADIGDYSGFTVAQVVETRLGSEFFTNLVDPVFTGVHGSSARDLPAAHFMEPLLTRLKSSGSLIGAAAALRTSQARPGAAIASLRGGLFQLVEVLQRELEQQGVEFDFGIRVESLEEFEAKVTLACSPAETARLLGYEPASPIAANAKLIFALVNSKQLNDFPLGSGALVAGSAVKATTHVNAKWGWVHSSLQQDEHLIRLSLNADVNDVGTALSSLYEAPDLQVLGAVSKTWPKAMSAGSAVGIAEIAEQRQVELCGSLVSGNGLLGITRDHYERKNDGQI